MTKNLYINMLIYGSVFILIIIIYSLMSFPKHPIISCYFLLLGLVCMGSVWPETKIKQAMSIDKLKGLQLKEYYYFRYIFVYIGLLIISIIIYFIFESYEPYSTGLFTMLITWCGTTVVSFFKWKDVKEELNKLTNKPTQ
ncbi:hypothetical protein ACMGE7_02120 [Macrococcus equi]|uniref:hypothetical protein n=1 Tax=Macrococcus equi TaxID=3395462 RepID=UPI0039BE16EB